VGDDHAAGFSHRLHDRVDIKWGQRARIDDLQANLLDFRAEVRSELQSVRDELQDVRGELQDVRGEIGGVRNLLIDHIEGHVQGAPDD